MKPQHSPQEARGLPAQPAPEGETHLQDATCRHCGAALLTPTATTRFDQVPGAAHAKRALEVALVGRFSITFVGIGSAYAEALALAQIGRHHGLTTFCVLPCPCGNVGDTVRTCVCTPAQIARMMRRKAYRAAQEAAMQIEVVAPTFGDRLGLLRRPGEADEVILQRVRLARARPVPDQGLPGATQRLLQAAIRQLDLDAHQIQTTLRIAAAVAQLADQAEIGPAHLAEAIQYRRRDAPPRDAVR